MIFNLLSQSKNTFEGIRAEETVVHLLRRHWIVPLLAIVSFILGVVFPLIVFLIMWMFVGFYGYGSIIFLAYSMYVLVLWLSLFYTLTLYSLDVWIITNQRIIDSRQHGFFNRTVSELTLSRVQDISIEVGGLIQTFLDYGNLKVQSAGTEEHFLFLQIPHPALIKDEIMKLTTIAPQHHP
jgi:membrane protein YdbS with pleckstrin-like domain